MRWRRTARACALVFAFAAFAGCATTQVADVWRDPAYRGPGFERVLVAAVAREEGVRRRLEDELVLELRKRGVEAAPSYEFIQTSSPRVEDLHDAIEAFDADAVLLTGAIQASTRERLTYGAYGPSFGFGWGPWLYPAYGAAWGFAYAPVVERDLIVQVPIDLYAVDGNGRLVWSGQSRSIDPSSLVSVLDDMSKETAERLAESGLLAGQAHG